MHEKLVSSDNLLMVQELFSQWQPLPEEYHGIAVAFLELDELTDEEFSQSIRGKILEDGTVLIIQKLPDERALHNQFAVHVLDAGRNRFSFSLSPNGVTSLKIRGEWHFKVGDVVLRREGPSYRFQTQIASGSTEQTLCTQTLIGWIAEMDQQNHFLPSPISLTTYPNI